VEVDSLAVEHIPVAVDTLAGEDTLVEADNLVAVDILVVEGSLVEADSLVAVESLGVEGSSGVDSLEVEFAARLYLIVVVREDQDL
jgi:hypothetical protein